MCFLTRFCLPLFRFDASLKKAGQEIHNSQLPPILRVDLVTEPVLRGPCLQDSCFHRDRGGLEQFPTRFFYGEKYFRPSRYFWFEGK